MRVVCYTCPHGLVPGPYADWNAEHQAEHAWLLDVCAHVLLGSHVVIPTEAFGQWHTDFAWHKLAWMCEQARQRYMVPVVWADKWLWTRPMGEVRRWWAEAWRSLEDYNPALLLASEVDLLWELHNASRRDVLQKLCLAREHLADLGVHPVALWAGGATVEGTLQVDRALCPGVLTWTAWRAVQRGLERGNVYSAVLEDVATLRRERAHAGEVCAIEVGWSEALGGTEHQARVLWDAVQAVRDVGATPGLWTTVDWPHDLRSGDVETNYGVLREDGTEKPALREWQRA